MDKKLIEYLPSILQTFAEFKEIMRVEQPQIDQLWDDLDSLLNEAFISDESAIGAKRWESILDITPLDTDSVEVRNFRIRGRLLEDAPYTYRSLCNQLGALCGEDGYSVVLNHDAYTLKIRVALKSKSLKHEVDKLTERVVPLNLILDVDLMYNTHRIIKNTGLTNAQLKAYTHSQLREEPFED